MEKNERKFWFVNISEYNHRTMGLLEGKNWTLEGDGGSKIIKNCQASLIMNDPYRKKREYTDRNIKIISNFN